MAVSWYFAGGGSWQALSDEDSRTLENGYQKAKSTSTFEAQVPIGPQRAIYDIDFQGMTQKNPKSGKVRQLRREEVAQQTCPAGHTLEQTITPQDGYSCNACQDILPKGTVMGSCRKCNFDMCPSCREKQATTPKCPSGHALEMIRTPEPGYTCDACKKPQPKHASMGGCRACNYDVCEACQSRQGSGASAGTAPQGSAAECPWHVGDDAECYSISGGVWLAAKVIEVKDGKVTVTYVMPNGNKVMKILDVQGANVAHLRKPTATASSAPAEAAPIYAAGGARASVGTGYPQERPAPTLDDVPGLGERSTQEIQEDIRRRLQRLLRHGDLEGAERTMALCRLLNLGPEELANEVKQLQALKADGAFSLLLPRSAGA